MVNDHTGRSNALIKDRSTRNPHAGSSAHCRV